MQTNFVKPRYDSGGFASLPQRIIELLTAPQKYDAVVLFLIDSFGWRLFEKFQREPFLKTAGRLGHVEKMMAQFPSTTASHVTTLHTGMPVGEHGVFEWTYYEPTLDALISPLLFSFAGTGQRDTLKSILAKPQRLFPNTTIYQPLKKQGVTSTIYQHHEYTPSTFGEVVFSGARALGYKTLPEAIVNLADALVKISSPAYFVLYYDRVDAICHEYGPESPQVEAEIRVMLMTMETVFQSALAGSHRKILFMLTADHGQSETNPQTTVYINRDPRFAGVEKFLRTSQNGELLVPGGSARDFFLYIKPGMVEEAQEFFSQRLEGKAEVRKVAELMSDGYFGPKLSPRFCARAGDLVILPYRFESVWWYEKNKHEMKYSGHHGGLTAQEMEIPLLTWEL